MLATIATSARSPGAGALDYPCTTQRSEGGFLASRIQSGDAPAVLALLGIRAARRPPAAQDRPWLDQKLLAAAKKESGTLVVYGSMNEEEALPYYKIFENATGIKVSYVRASDTGIIGRIAVEFRAKQNSWDVVMTTPVNRLPDAVLAQIDPPQAKGLIPQARDPNRRWYGVYSNYNSPGLQHQVRQARAAAEDLRGVRSAQGMGGKVAIDKSDTEWVMAMYEHYGEAKGRKIIQDIVATLNPVMTEGHLALARSVAAGEYWVALNNYTNLTVNVKLAGAPTDYWALDPVALIFGSVGVAANAPNPNAARLLANFVAQPRSAGPAHQARTDSDAAGYAEQSAGRERDAAEAEGHPRGVLGGGAEALAGGVPEAVPVEVSVSDPASLMKHVPTIIAVVVLIGMLVWLYLYAPCGVFYWNNAKDMPERCHAELGRG